LTFLFNTANIAAIMKTIISTFAFVFFIATIVVGQTVFVRTGGNGNGASWAQASGNLAAVLKTVTKGTQIWVAKGTYTPSTTNRKASFVIADGVALYGGFAGNETTLAQRDVYNNITTLSGEIGDVNNIEDNTQNVIATKNCSKKTIVDGFTIASGNATGEGEGNERAGAGWYNDGSNGASNPTIRNCSFENNMANDGAAIFNFAQNGECSPAIENCTFKHNKVVSDGGAIFNDGRSNGKCMAQLTNCTFESNQANYGGAIFNSSTGGNCSPVLVDCEFINNKAAAKGGAIFHLNRQGNDNTEIANCRFNKNIAREGVNIFTAENNSVPTANEKNASPKANETTKLVKFN
jgi:Chlamydia polymorphic membrane protein (Chlamydia_PMP) repeat